MRINYKYRASLSEHRRCTRKRKQRHVKILSVAMEANPRGGAKDSGVKVEALGV